METNSEILNNWNRVIESYPKINIETAKEILIDIRQEKDINTKNEKRNYLICGTLHVIYDFISINNLDIINNAVYDLEDIMNSCYEIWIEMIDDETILNANNYNDLLQMTFYSRLSSKLLQKEDLSVHEYFDLLSVNNFKDIFSIYLEMKQYKATININNFILELNKSSNNKAFQLYNKIICNSYNDYLRDYYLKEIQTIIRIFDNIYDSMNIKDIDTLDLSRTKINYLKHLLVNNGIEHSYKNITEVAVDDFSDELIDRIIDNEIYSYVFNESSLTDREKEIVYDRYYKLKTLEEIGKKYNLTRESIRRIEAKSLRKLRYPFLRGRYE